MNDGWLNEFIGCFDGVTKDKLSIEEGFTIKYQNLPKNIYKFRSVNKHSLNNLSDGTVWLTSPSKYNDPYDCGATLSYSDLARTTSPSFVKDLLQKMEPHLPSIELEQIQKSENPLMELTKSVLRKEKIAAQDNVEELAKKLLNVLDEIMLESTNQMIEFVKSSLKICSFCSTLHPMLMWTHYASNHEGFCMEYEVSEFSDIIKRLLFPVIYSPSLFDCTKYYAEAINNRESFNNIYAQVQALYKSPEWSYEKEWRLVFAGGMIENDMNYYIGLPKRAYLGARVSREDRTKIIKICKEKQIEVHTMQLTPNKFELTSRPI